MAALTAPLIFQHCPLPDAKTHIRLLKLLSVVKTRAVPVHCELTTFPITEAPPYRAISYTWGDPAPLASILVNGQQMDVRLNCEHALRQASQHTGDGTGDIFIWIDSICVNQLDNDEKSAQVAMMGRIFKTATQIFACVGAHGDDSEFLYGFLRREEARFQSILLSDAIDSWETDFFQEVKLRRRQLAAWRLKHSKSVLIRLCKALAKFLARPYFHRVWVYQELFLGRDIGVYCGDEPLPISWIWVTASIVNSWLMTTTYTDFFLFIGSRHLGLWNFLTSKIAATKPLLLAGAKEQPLMRFSRATEAVAALSCQDPRDRVYGILSLVIPVESEHFRPDYAKDRLDLAVEVLQKTRVETDAVISDFERNLASYARRVGLNLNLKDEPSQKLVAAIKLRRSSTIMQETVPNLMGSRHDKNNTDCWPFVGFRIILQNEEWRFEHQDTRFLRHGPTFMPPKFKTRPQSDEVPSASVGIRLPPEAQDGDWLLIPRSGLWMGQFNYPGEKIAFLARHYDSVEFEIVGKVLISFKRKVSKWEKTFEKGASTFKVYCDPEDLLVLFDSCKWDSLWAAHKLEDPELHDAYFQTRFCGQRFSSYAVRMKT